VRLVGTRGLEGMVWRDDQAAVSAMVEAQVKKQDILRFVALEFGDVTLNRVMRWIVGVQVVAKVDRFGKSAHPAVVVAIFHVLSRLESKKEADGLERPMSKHFVLLSLIETPHHTALDGVRLRFFLGPLVNVRLEFVVGRQCRFFFGQFGVQSAVEGFHLFSMAFLLFSNLHSDLGDVVFVLGELLSVVIAQVGELRKVLVNVCHDLDLIFEFLLQLKDVNLTLVAWSSLW